MYYNKLNMITLYIKEMLKLKNLKPTASTLVKMGMTWITANNMLNNQAKSISFENLEKICIGLNCTPNELFNFIPDKKGLGPDYVLHEIKKQVSPLSLQDVLQRMPMKELIEKTKILIDNESTKNINK